VYDPSAIKEHNYLEFRTSMFNESFITLQQYRENENSKINKATKKVK